MMYMQIVENGRLSFSAFLVMGAYAMLPLGGMGGGLAFDVISTLNYIQGILTRVGPLLSAILFIIAGIFYAIGQLFPSHQRASFHTTAGDMVMGAIIVAVLSVTANGFALASTHLLSNGTAANLT